MDQIDGSISAGTGAGGGSYASANADVALPARQFGVALDACRAVLADHSAGLVSDAQLLRALRGTELAMRYERLIAVQPDDAAQPAFRATHAAPANGMSTWAEPGDSRPGPRLDPGLEVELAQEWGDWARITCDNGWTAWVDARQLLPLGAIVARSAVAPVPATPARQGGGSPGPWFVTPSKATWPVSAGAAAIALGAFLPWFDLGPGLPTQSAFDAALKYLVDYENPGTGLRIGLALLLVAGGAFVARHMRGWEKAVRPLAAAGVAICALFVVQTQRLLGAAEDAGGVVPGVLDVVGVGVWISLAGAVLLTWGASCR